VAFGRLRQHGHFQCRGGSILVQPCAQMDAVGRSVYPVKPFAACRIHRPPSTRANGSDRPKLDLRTATAVRDQPAIRCAGSPVTSMSYAPDAVRRFGKVVKSWRASCRPPMAGSHPAASARASPSIPVMPYPASASHVSAPFSDAANTSKPRPLLRPHAIYFSKQAP
jgi:hypothetical protein